MKAIKIIINIFIITSLTTLAYADIPAAERQAH